MSDDDRNPWDKQRGETGAAYEAWVVYRNLPRDTRNYSEVARQLQKTHTVIGKWAKLWDWRERELEWEAYLTELEVEREQGRRKQIIEEQLAVAARFKVITAKHVNHWLRQIETAEERHEPLPFTPKDVATMYGIALKIEADHLARVPETAPSMRVYLEDA